MEADHASRGRCGEADDGSCRRIFHFHLPQCGAPKARGQPRSYEDLPNLRFDVGPDDSRPVSEYINLNWISSCNDKLCTA